MTVSEFLTFHAQSPGVASAPLIIFGPKDKGLRPQLELLDSFALKKALCEKVLLFKNVLTT